MRTAWGVFKAVQLTGMEDRDDFYRFWYNAVDLEPAEPILSSWKVMIESGGVLGAIAGNLLLTDRRLILEPMSSKRAAYAPHGMKFVINGLAKMQERKAPPMSRASLLTQLTAAPGNGKKATLAVTDSDGTVAFLFSVTRVPIGTGHVERRDEALARIRAASTNARLRA
jgi:hypothetical protein